MISEKELADYLSHGFSVLLEGRHGTGKTAIVKEACDSLGWKLKSYTVSLMDPYIDLVGIPVPRTDENGKEYMKLLRPKDIEDADVIFLDELNRGEIKTLNAVLELVQFGTINGEALPRLKAVVAAQNPAGDIYDTIELDKALVDRFDIFIEVKPMINIPYFTKTFNRDIAQVVSKWYKERGPKADYISPRRMEKICQLYAHNPTKRTLEMAMPPNGTYEVGKLFAMLQETTETPEEKKARLAREKAALALQKKKEAEAILQAKKDFTDKMKNLPNIPVEKARRQFKTFKMNQVMEYINSGDSDIEDVKDTLAEVLSHNVSIPDLTSKYKGLFVSLGTNRTKNMTKNWSQSKISQLRCKVSDMVARDKTIKSREDCINHPLWDVSEKVLKTSNGRHPLKDLADRRKYTPVQNKTMTNKGKIEVCVAYDE